MRWNFGDVFETVMETVPGDHIALIGDGRTISWQALEQRTRNLAHALLAQGLLPGDKVAFYMRNSPAYIELAIACFRAGLVHVNVNYRYREQELIYLLDDSDSVALVFDEEFLPLVEIIRHQVPMLRTLLVNDKGEPRSDGFGSLEVLSCSAPLHTQPLQRSPDDLFFIYTGGTTGMPKGVMWSHDTLITAQLAYSASAEGHDMPRNLAEFQRLINAGSMATRQLPAPPLMHATGILAVIGALFRGGSVVTVDDRQGFRPDAVWTAIDDYEVTHLTIVGDAFASPLLDYLNNKPGKHKLDSLQAIISSGVAWSKESKAGLLKHLPQIMLVDSLGSSEAPACGISVSTRDSEGKPPVFMLSQNCQVFTESGEPVEPGSGEVGYLAMSGNIPEGYYKDPQKTAKTFRIIQGRRYALPGDLCRVEADGQLSFLGRGSQCINTGGEKVFVEEVEEVLKTHGSVADALVFGSPDPKWGQAVNAVVSLKNGSTADPAQLIGHVRETLAAYKAPKHLTVVEQVPRHANGKADYQRARELATQSGGES